MDTLLKRLRLSAHGAVPLHVSHYQKDCGDAADEIERLRKRVEELDTIRMNYRLRYGELHRDQQSRSDA